MYIHKLSGLFLLAALSVPSFAQNTGSHSVLPEFPPNAHWRNQPAKWKVNDGALIIQSAAKTNWYAAPTGDQQVAATPLLLFPAPKDFWFSAKVTVGFQSTFDAGALVVYADEQNWVKFAFESQDGKTGTIVSVVTREISDDNTGAPIEGNSVYLKVSKTGQAIFLFYSTDGKNWKVTRAFDLGTEKPLQFGFSSQSPNGTGATATFSEIRYKAETLKPWSSGE
jgi:regulation of enolase protein 1 (concanavalin A-like superfamily)